MIALGALVQWLKEETHNQKVMSSNPGVGYWMDIFHIILLKNMYCLLEKTKSKRKRGRGWPIFINYNDRFILTVKCVKSIKVIVSIFFSIQACDDNIVGIIGPQTSAVSVQVSHAATQCEQIWRNFATLAKKLKYLATLDGSWAIFQIVGNCYAIGLISMTKY